jgi:hypothetical protein
MWEVTFVDHILRILIGDYGVSSVSEQICGHKVKEGLVGNGRHTSQMMNYIESFGSGGEAGGGLCQVSKKCFRKAMHALNKTYQILECNLAIF